MLELLVALGFILLSRITIGDIISVSSLGKGLISKIGESGAFDILKKALNKTRKEVKDEEAENILKGLSVSEELSRELHGRVSAEAKEELVSKYFKGREDVLEKLAKNYYELSYKAAISKGKGKEFKEFVILEIEKLQNLGIVTEEKVERIEKHLIEFERIFLEELKRKKEAESRQFLITSDLKEVGSEILTGKPQIEYVEREEIEEVKDALKTTNKLFVVGKPGAGKSKFMLRILEDFNGYEKFVVIRSFFREDGINSLDVELQELDSFILIWDDLHRVKKELVNQTLIQIEQLARDYGKKYMFIGASRMEGEYYQFKPEEIKLEDFRSSELIEKCSAYFGISIEGEAVKERLLEVGDGTPFYVVSLFATSKERGKKRLTVEDLKTLPNDSFTIWQKHLNFLESEGRLSTSEKNVLRSIALAMWAVPAIDIEVLEKFYEQIFRGDLSEFDYALDEVVKKFFIGIEGELCSMHAVQAAVVEEKYPVGERKIERLKEVFISLEREGGLILLWGFANWFYKNKKYGNCLKFWDVFIEKEPNIDVAYNNRGLAYAELNQYERAIEDYNEAIKLNSNYAEGYSNRGLAYAELNQYESAIEDYNEAIKLNPNLAEAYYNRGIAYAELKKYERAIEDYNKAIELNPKYAEAYNNRGIAYAELRKYGRAIEDYNQAIELNPNLVMAYNNRGIAYAELRKYGRAIEDYNRAIELNPNLVMAYNNRGATYAKLKKYERATEDYNEAIKLNPKYVVAYSNRGLAYAELKKYERAIEDYDKALDLNPKYVVAYSNRGLAYAELKKYERAIEDYDKALDLNPQNAEAYTNRGAAYANLNLHERAIEDYDKALELNPQNAMAYTNRGAAYANLNLHERAIEDCDKALDLNPQNAEAYTNRGAAYANLNLHERAIEDYDKALELNPKYAMAYHNRGGAYANLKQYERAIEDYNKAIELNPNYAKAYGNRGIAYSEIGKYEESVRDMKKSGILFFYSGREDNAVKVFSICFKLREEIESDDVIYCGIALFLLTLNPEVILALRKMKAQDETLRKIFDLALVKLRGKDISNRIAMLEEKEKTGEKKILLELLKRL